jgi:hypothetical protein
MAVFVLGHYYGSQLYKCLNIKTIEAEKHFKLFLFVKTHPVIAPLDHPLSASGKRGREKFLTSATSKSPFLWIEATNQIRTLPVIILWLIKKH